MWKFGIKWIVHGWTKQFMGEYWKFCYPALFSFPQVSVLYFLYWNASVSWNDLWLHYQNADKKNGNAHCQSWVIGVVSGLPIVVTLNIMSLFGGRWFGCHCFLCFTRKEFKETPVFCASELEIRFFNFYFFAFHF